MTCRTIIAPARRIEAISDDWRFRGLELAARSKSSDVYVVVRLNSKAALYLKALALNLGQSISGHAENTIRFDLHHQFCARGVPEWRHEFTQRVMGLNEREALVELLDREQEIPSILDELKKHNPASTRTTTE